MSDIEELRFRGEEYFSNERFTEALQCFKTLAEAGDPNGLFRVAQAYDFGFGTDVSKELASEYYQRAAERGYADAAPLAEWLQTHPEYVKMVDGKPYDPNAPCLQEKRRECRRVTTAFQESGGNMDLLHPLLHMHPSVRILPPFICDYGEQLFMGEGTTIAHGCLILDSAPVYIGRHTVIGEGVHIYTATHPLAYRERNSGFGFSRPVHIGSHVRVGSFSVICPGVNIGDGAVVEPGAVVNRDIPPGHVAGGNPAVSRPA